MPRRLPDRCRPDSIGEFRAAAAHRFQDGIALATAGRRTAAIYVWGYAAEMTLKAGYFTVMGFPDAQVIVMADLRAAAASAPGLGLAAWPAPYRFHDLSLWAELLVATRRRRPGMAYPSRRFGDQVVARSQRAQRLWRENLRYHKNHA
jgi:hypothetical protein